MDVEWYGQRKKQEQKNDRSQYVWAGCDEGMEYKMKYQAMVDKMK